jgi:hypothetical protein
MLYYMNCIRTGEKILISNLSSSSIYGFLLPLWYLQTILNVLPTI